LHTRTDCLYYWTKSIIPWCAKYCNFLCIYPRKDGKIGYENDNIETFFKKLNAVLNYYDLKPFKIKKIVGHLRKYHGKETDTMHIDIEDVMKIYRFDCKENNQVNLSWLKARDLYVFCFFTGRRYDELFYLKSGSIDHRIDINKAKSSVLKYVSDKTGAPNDFVINNVCEEIINRWKEIDFEVKYEEGGKVILVKEPLLPVISNVKANKYLKELLEEIAFSRCL
jgi:hypothetical protein